MADPVSLLGTVISASGAAAQLTVTLFKLINDIKGAPQTLHEYQQETSQFRDLLRQVETILENREKSETAQEQLAPIKLLLENCKDHLNNAKDQFLQHVGNGSQLSLSQKLRLLVKKDTFVASRTHMQMVSQILTLHLQRIAVIETFQISDAQIRVEESQVRTEKEILKLEPILRAMQGKLAMIERHITDVEEDDQSATIVQSCSDDEGFEISHERYLARYATHLIDSGREFEVCMKDKAQTVFGSEIGSEVGGIQKWRDEVAEEANHLDEAIDVRTPTQSERSFMKDLDIKVKDLDLKESINKISYHQHPNFLRSRVDCYQQEVSRQEAAGAFAGARENQIKSIEILEKLEASHGVVFDKRVPYNQRLAHLYMQDDTLESYEEAASIIKGVQQDTTSDDGELTSELHQMLAVAYLGKKDWTHAEYHAGIALEQRENLPGPPAALVGESAGFIIDYYERQNDTDSASMAHGLRAVYGQYLTGTPSTPVGRRPRQGSAKPSSIKKFPSTSTLQSSMSSEAIWLRDHGFDIGPRDYRDRINETTKQTPIITLIAFDKPSELNILRRLIEGGASVDAPDGIKDKRMTPIMWAVKHKNKLALDLLLNKNADTRLRDLRGQTALHVAVDEDTTSLAERLYKEDAEMLQLSDKFGATPMHYATERKSTKMARWLLNRGADLDLQDSDGRTPLHIAVQNDAIELTRLLLSSHPAPSFSIRDNEGQTAQSMAKSKGKNSQMYHLLSAATSPDLRLQRSMTARAAASTTRLSSQTERKPSMSTGISRSMTEKMPQVTERTPSTPLRPSESGRRSISDGTKKTSLFKWKG